MVLPEGHVKLERDRGVRKEFPSKIHASLVHGEGESAPTVPHDVGWMAASVLDTALIVEEGVGLHCGFWAGLGYC